MNFFTLTSTFIVIPPLILNYSFFTSNLHLYSHGMYFVNVFDSFIHAIMLKTLRIKSSVLFGIHTLLDKSFRVLQPPTHQSNLTASR